MKKYILALLIIGSSLNAFSQNTVATDTTQIKEKQNEFKVNAAYLLAGFPEITYERILSQESAFGVSVAFSLRSDIDYEWLILPYYRIYFSKQQARGFFIEGDGTIFSAKTEEHNHYDYDSNTQTYHESTSLQGLGLGIATGAKFITKRGWVGEIYLGIIRNFKNISPTKSNLRQNYQHYLEETLPRMGLTIGKRF